MRTYPVALVVEGLPVLVVGGGRVAARKVRGLVEAGAAVHVVATSVCDDIRGVSGVTWEERPYDARDVVDRRLVVTATGDRAVDAAVHDDADRAGVWVNAADDPTSCTFLLPSVLRRGDLTIAVSTGGRSPAAASWLRARFEDEIGPEYGALVDLLAEARDGVRAGGRSSESVDWRAALDSGILDLVRDGRVAEARERLHAWL